MFVSAHIKCGEIMFQPCQGVLHKPETSCCVDTVKVLLKMKPVTNGTFVAKER